MKESLIKCVERKRKPSIKLHKINIKLEQNCIVVIANKKIPACCDHHANKNNKIKEENHIFKRNIYYILKGILQ